MLYGVGGLPSSLNSSDLQVSFLLLLEVTLLSGQLLECLQNVGTVGTEWTVKFVGFVGIAAVGIANVGIATVGIVGIATVRIVGIATIKIVGIVIHGERGGIRWFQGSEGILWKQFIPREIFVSRIVCRIWNSGY